MNFFIYLKHALNSYCLLGCDKPRMLISKLIKWTPNDGLSSVSEIDASPQCVPRKWRCYAIGEDTDESAEEVPRSCFDFIYMLVSLVYKTYTNLWL